MLEQVGILMVRARDWEQEEKIEEVECVKM